MLLAACRYIGLLAGLDQTDFCRTLTALLHFYHEAGATADAHSLEAVFCAVQTILEHSRRNSPPAGTCALELKLVETWCAPPLPSRSQRGPLAHPLPSRSRRAWPPLHRYAPEVPSSAQSALLERAAVHFKEHVLLPRQKAYAERRAAKQSSTKDAALERVIFALVGVFVTKIDNPLIIGFRSLVPAVFDVYLARGSQCRTDLGGMLGAAGFDAGLVERIREEDSLVRQPFFWSAAGMKLFGDHPELKISAKLHALIIEALGQEAMIVASFIELLLTRAETSPPMIEAAELSSMLLTTLQAMLQYVASLPLEKQPSGFEPRFLVSVELLLYAASRHRDAVFAPIEREMRKLSGLAAPLLERVARKLMNSLGLDEADMNQLLEDESAAGAADEASVVAGDTPAPEKTMEERMAEEMALAAGEAAAAAEDGSGIRGQGKDFETSVILGLALCFIHAKEALPAFRRLVPHVFTTHLVLGTPARADLNEHLAFDDALVHLVTESDDLVGASFFWHGEVCGNHHLTHSPSPLSHPSPPSPPLPLSPLSPPTLSYPAPTAHRC